MDDWGERTWQGAGFTAPLTPGRIVADDPATFQAALRWTRLDGIRVEMFTAGPHRYSLTQEQAEANPEPSIITFAVGEGEVELLGAPRPVVMRRGDVVLGAEARSSEYHARTPVRLLWSTLAMDRVPDHLVRIQELPLLLPRTRLVNSYIAFLSALLTSRSSAEFDSAPPAHLVRALIDLQIGVLAERRNSDRQSSAQPDLRGRIEEYVLEHLGDPELGPARIADALGISLRYAHQVFNREGETLAQYIRDRRLDSVAAALRDPSGPDRLSELAVRHGFASRDQLTRAFRRRYAVTMSEYRERQLADR